jgi:hypothetical protein
VFAQVRNNVGMDDIVKEILKAYKSSGAQAAYEMKQQTKS